MKKVVLIAIIIAIVSGAALKAQVTIGSNVPANPGSLLDLKTNNNVGTNATGGFIFPRVNIANMTPTTGTELAASIGGTGDWDLQTHIGLVVYNVNSAAPGLHIWDGTEWITFAASTALPIVVAGNGLNKNGTTEAIELGGNLTQTTTTITGNDQGIVFDFNAATVDNADQGLFIPNLPNLLTDRYPLAVNVTTGKVGLLAGESEAKIAFLQSNNYAYLSTFTAGSSADLDNSNRTYTIPWSVPNLSSGNPSTGGDIVTNNLIEFDPSDNSCVLLEDVAVELSGYIGYAANVLDAGPSGTGSNNGGITIVNASIQVKYAREGTSAPFQNYSSVRGVYLNDMTAYRQTLNIPPAMLVGRRGDKIRMVVIPRPRSGTTDLGVAHSKPAVVTPYGSDFCKSLKIVAQ